MIIGIGVMNPFDNDDNKNEEKEAKTCQPNGENCCDQKCADAPKGEDTAEKPDMGDILLRTAELLAEIAPEEHKPVLLAPSIGSKINDVVRHMLRIIMAADGIDATCKVAAIGVEAMNRSLIMLSEAEKKMKEASNDA